MKEKASWRWSFGKYLIKYIALQKNHGKKKDDLNWSAVILKYPKIHKSPINFCKSRSIDFLLNIPGDFSTTGIIPK